jgi:hypothetical protein
MKHILLTCIAFMAMTQAVHAEDNSVWSAEHRAQSTINYLRSKCGTGEYILGFEGPSKKQGWKVQREFLCTDQLEKYPEVKSLDGKKYTKEQLKKEDEESEFVYTVLMP